MTRVRRATPADKEAIFDFIRRAYPGRWEFKIPHRWEWEFVENPFIQGAGLPIWIAVDGRRRVAGQTCALIEPLKLGSRIVRVGWSVDTYVLPEYRGQGLGRQLQKANAEAHDVFMSLSMSPANRRIKASLGSSRIEPATTFVRTLRHTPASVRSALQAHAGGAGSPLGRGLARLSQAFGLDRAAARTLHDRRERLDARVASRLGTRPTISPVERFDEEVDALWEEVSPCFPALIRRDHVYLNWKFVRQPHMQHLRFVARRQGRLCGYLILRAARPPEPNLGILVDLFASPHDAATVESLLEFTVKHFKEAGADAVLAATTAPAFRWALRKFGFKKTGEIYPMFHCRLDEAECRQALRPGSWLLGKGDHDWDQYPLAHG